MLGFLGAFNIESWSPCDNLSKNVILIKDLKWERLPHFISELSVISDLNLLESAAQMSKPQDFIP